MKFKRTEDENLKSCDGRVVKASDSKSDGVTRTGSNPVRSEFFSYKNVLLKNQLLESILSILI